ncbi:TonB-dependent receptor [Wenzhouxiangella sp. XN79A]|uniref:TonB-dependent receptor plug domain-containing protein n=1 Tax=Wenzhouxiangella sp. XN79A TaxID=2724193 RepID=UPI00144A7458|nr:TonB-dependent receptor [Wenzhouxiangella sp. XN79A]NKI36154.1 TonB-dependent receptor [Wenzhouxiangella sp. XN79A]
MPVHPLARPTLLLAFALLVPGSLLAQSPADPDADQDDALDRVVVTGSRVQSAIRAGARPLTRIDRDFIETSGAVRLGDLLQQLPMFSGSPLNTRTSQRGQGGGLSRGIETLELRGLGPERTLVLVNGRRFVPGGSGASGLVDLGMIPTAWIEAVEIYRAGASVEYGADAVAGVVNILTRRRIDGLELDAQGRITERNDAETLQASVLAGRTGERGGWLAGLEVVDQPSVSKGDRGFSSARLTLDGPDNQRVFDGSSAPPSGQYRSSFGRFTLRDGQDGDELTDFRPFTDADRFNFNPFEDLLQASTRTTLFGSGEWTFGHGVRGWVEALAHHRESSAQLAPLPLFTTRETDVVVDENNLYNPFGETLVDVRRRLVEAGPRRFEQDNDAWRVAAGLDGWIGQWSWDASLTWGRNETDQRQTGDLLDDRLRSALGPSFRADGTAICGTPDDPIPGCVPLNLFGGPGSITDAMLAYVGADLRDTGYNEQRVVELNLLGDLVTLPAGPLATAFGFQYREEEGAETPDPRTQAGNTTGSARGATRGTFEAAEAYIEFGVPITPDLELDLGLRGVDFSNFGSDAVFETGLAWRASERLTISAQYSEAFRAPNIGELFGAQSQANPIVIDPCARFEERTPEEVQRCIDQGVPADGSFTQSGEETPELSGGNPALTPERATVRAVGLAWRIPGLASANLRIDAYDIDIENGIGALGAETVLNQCLATGAAAFCDAVERAPGGAITAISARLQNLAREETRGIDLEADWTVDAFGGRLGQRLLLAWVDERKLVAFPGAEPLFGAGDYDPDRFGAIPEWQGRYRLDWRHDRWKVGYSAQWIDAIEERGGEVFPGTVNRAGSVLYHDLFAGLDLGDWQLTAGVDNLTDVRPPFLANADEGNTDFGTYRLLGTTYWLRLGARFGR